MAFIKKSGLNTMSRKVSLLYSLSPCFVALHAFIDNYEDIEMIEPTTKMFTARHFA